MGRRVAVFVADVLVVAWLAVWVAAGLYVNERLGELRQLGDTADQAAVALDSTAEGLRSLDHVPFVGEDIGRVAGDVARTAGESRRSAERSRQAVDAVAPVVGAAVAAAVVVPTVLSYLPLRLRMRRRRDRRRPSRAPVDGSVTDLRQGAPGEPRSPLHAGTGVGDR